MKVKNNTENLILRHLTGGLVLKYATGLNIKWIGARGLTYNSKNNPGEYRVIDGRVLKKRFYGWTDIGPVVTEPTNTQFKVDTPEVRAERERLYNERMSGRKSTNKPTSQRKSAGTRGNGTRSDTRGGTSKTITTSASTSTESPTNITDQNWLTARNNAMTRGWGSYIYNGLTYAFKGKDLDNAKNNWRINGGRLDTEALGLLGITTSENKPVETMLPAITLADTDRVLAEVDANIKANSPRLLLVNDGMYGVLFALKNPGASVAGLSYARLSGNKGVGEYNKQNTSPAFYDQITNWYANNRPAIDNYFNNNTDYSQNFNLKVLNFLDRYKQYRSKYTFARKGSKLLKSNNLYK